MNLVAAAATLQLVSCALTPTKLARRLHPAFEELDSIGSLSPKQPALQNLADIPFVFPVHRCLNKEETITAVHEILFRQ